MSSEGDGHGSEERVSAPVLVAAAALVVLPLAFSIRLGPDPTGAKGPLAWLAAGCVLLLWGVRREAGAALAPLLRPPGVFLLGWLAWAALSLVWSPSAGMGAERLFRMLPGCVFFAVGAGAGRRERLALVAAIAVGGTLVGAYGLAQMLGFDPVDWARRGVPFATMGNENMLAQYLELTLPCVLLVAARLPVRTALFWLPAYPVLLWLLLLGTCSRGAALGTVVGLGALFACAARVHAFRERRLKRVFIFAAVAFVLVAVFASGPIPGAVDRGRPSERTLSPWEEVMTVARFDLPSNRFRIEAWRDALAMWRDYPAAGAGAGAFHVLWPRYASEELLRMAVEYEAKAYHAHNEYLHALAELGPLGAGLLVCFVGGTLVLLWRRAREGDPAYPPCLALGLVALAFHAGVSFPFSSAATFAAFCTMAGLAGGAGPGRPPAPGGRRWPVVTGGVLALAMLPLVIRPVLADRAMWHAGRALDAPSRLAWLERARRLAPWRPEISFLIGVTAEEMGDLSVAARAYERCRALEPYGYQALTNLALVRAKLGDSEGAEDAFQAAIAANPLAARTLVAYAGFLAEQGRLEEAVKTLYRLTETDPGPRWWYELGRIWEAWGRLGEAVDLYEKAALYLEHGRRGSPDWEVARLAAERADALRSRLEQGGQEE